MNEYTCLVDGCDYEIFAVGLQDPDEPDYFTEDIEAHKRGHVAEQGHIALGDDGTESEAVAKVQAPSRPLPKRHEVHDLIANGDDCCDTTDAVMALLRGAP